VSIFHEVVDKLMPKPTVNFRDEDFSSFDRIMEQRRFNMQVTAEMKLQQGLITKQGAGSDGDPK
jgi:DNA replication licensing factor MCM7